MQITLFGSLWDLTIGIAAGLSVLGLQRLSKKTGKSAKAKKVARLTKDYNEALYFSVHPHHLICILLLRCMAIMVYGVYLILLVKIDVTRLISTAYLAFLPTPPQALKIIMDVLEVILL
jgi:hypothetical protein